MISEEQIAALRNIVIPYIKPVMFSNIVRIAETAENFSKYTYRKYILKRGKIKRYRVQELRSYTIYKTKTQKV